MTFTVSFRPLLLATFALSLFLASATLADESADGFSDLPQGHPHYHSVTSLVDQGILQGFEDGSFRPEQAVTRAEAMKIILLGMEVDIPGLGPEPEESTDFDALFSDVPNDAWFFSYVQEAAEREIVSGYDDGTFAPGATVNLAEAMKILMLAGEIEAPNLEEVDFIYSDVPLEAWFAAFAQHSKAWNIAPVKTDGLWHPGSDVSRGLLAEMVRRQQLANESGEAFLESTHWPREQFPTVNVLLKVPFGWSYKGDGVGAIWLSDTANGQLSLLSPEENGSTLLMTRYSNPEGQSADALFDPIEDQLSSKAGSSLFAGEINGNRMITSLYESGVIRKEWYVYLEDSTLVHLQHHRGGGLYAPTLDEHMELIVRSLRYLAPGTLATDEAVSSMRAAIQVDGEGKANLDLLTDLALIETDAIGVGTGPIDYFYSPSADITIKYERSFDVILDLRVGQTSAF